MEHWDEVRTAFYVARSGTVSGAADQLGVHHATVIRHIDALEARLGVKLFQRHARGYTATEAGEDLARVAQATDDKFAQLQGRLLGQGEGVSGDLVVTALPAMSEMLMPVMASFQQRYPDVRLRYLAAERVFRLEYGEAHVALRVGQAPPDQADNVVQQFARPQIGLFASAAYLAQHGSFDDLTGHRFVGPEDRQTRAPFYQWMHANVPQDAIVWRSDDLRAAEAAISAGIGAGFVNVSRAKQRGLTEVIPRQDGWSSLIWLVTHVDLHRSTKVQAFLSHLKANTAAFDV